jgi:excisionase family DNA binding protein
MPFIGIWFLGMPLFPRSAAMTDEVLTIKEIATLLKLADKTVYSMAQQGELPAFKVRGQWRIRRADFDAWMLEQARTARLGEGKAD